MYYDFYTLPVSILFVNSNGNSIELLLDDTCFRCNVASIAMVSPSKVMEVDESSILDDFIGH